MFLFMEAKDNEFVEIGGKAIFKSTIGLIPFFGNTALEIYNEVQSKQVERKIKRLEEFYQSLDARLQTLEDRINKEFVSKDDFLDVFEETSQYIITERIDKKRNYFNNILVNSIISPICDFDQTERYLRLLDNLNEQELSILAVLDNPYEYNRRHGMIIKDPADNSLLSSWKQVTAGGVLTKILGINIHILTESITVLWSNGLIIDNSLDKNLHTNGNAVNVLDNLLTTRGRSFVKYLKW